ncbi:MAG: IPT/TIG domain-containing protein, partial [Chloroflexi bacterium]|nr:IPT/TIG domain-containing protein [Chloroflexota bacterium]
QANLARVATASASSTRPGFEFFVGAQRANDLRLTEGRARFAWVAAEGDQSPWVELRWPAPVTVTGVMLYPMAGTHIASAQLTGSDGTVLDLDHWPIDDTPLSVDWPAPVPVEWLRLTFQGRGPVGLAEWAVSGPADVSLPPVPQTAPTNLRPAFPGSSVAWLLWDPVPLAGLAGYRIHYGSAPGVYTAMADVGLVSHHLLTGLANGQTVYAVVRAVSTAEVEGPPSNEVSATIHAPVIESVTPTTGPLAGGTRVTITGRNLAPRGVVVRIGHRSYQVRVVNDHTVEAVTYHAWEPGPVDVEVVNPDGLNAVLPGGFTYQRP